MDIESAARKTIDLARKHAYLAAAYKVPGLTLSHIEDMWARWPIDGSETKRCRWLGWMQACVVAMTEGVVTLEDMKAINQAHAAGEPEPARDMPAIGFRRAHPQARIPQRATAGSAGADLHAVMPHDVDIQVIAPGQRLLVDTGLQIQIPIDWEVQIRPRSGLALKHGVSVLNAPATIDADYTGIIKVLLINLGDEPFEIRCGDRIAQMVASRLAPYMPREITSLARTERGEGGFGSTGTGTSP